MCMAAGDPASYEKDNRKAWWPGELSLEGGAASSVYRCASHQLSFVRDGQAIWVTPNDDVSTEHETHRCQFQFLHDTKMCSAC